jgi:hypothetical protein
VSKRKKYSDILSFFPKGKDVSFFTEAKLRRNLNGQILNSFHLYFFPSIKFIETKINYIWHHILVLYKTNIDNRCPA